MFFSFLYILNQVCPAPTAVAAPHMFNPRRGILLKACEADMIPACVQVTAASDRVGRVRLIRLKGITEAHICWVKLLET